MVPTMDMLAGALVLTLLRDSQPSRMSALGQKLSFDPDPPNVRFAPIADIPRIYEVGLRSAQTGIKETIFRVGKRLCPAHSRSASSHRD